MLPPALTAKRPSLVPAEPVASARSGSLATTHYLAYHIWLVFVKRQSVGWWKDVHPPFSGFNGMRTWHEEQKTKCN